jgi:hypothetical protein
VLVIGPSAALTAEICLGKEGGYLFASIFDRSADPTTVRTFPRIRCRGDADADLSCEGMTVSNLVRGFPPPSRTAHDIPVLERPRFWELALNVLGEGQAGSPTKPRKHLLVKTGDHCSVGGAIHFDEPTVAVRDDLMCAVATAEGTWIRPSDLRERDEFLLPDPHKRPARFRLLGRWGPLPDDTAYDPGFQFLGMTVHYRATD